VKTFDYSDQLLRLSLQHYTFQMEY